jgi:hypothetical protein
MRIRHLFAAGSLLVAFAAPASALPIPEPFLSGDSYYFYSYLEGGNVRPSPTPTGYAAYATVIWEKSTQQVYFQIEWFNTSSSPTLAQLHYATCGAPCAPPSVHGDVSPAVPGFDDLVFPANAGTGGVIEFIRPMSTVQFITTLDTWSAYLQIHTASYPEGEVRGIVIPEPLSAALLGLGLALLARTRGRKARSPGRCVDAR